jgi:excisionase family DNA binding protein
MHGEATELPELMTVAEVAKLWRQRRETIYRKVKSGEIRAVRLGDETAALRIPRDVVERVYEMSAVGSDSFAGEPTLGHGSSIDAPAARDGTSNSEAVEPARLAGDDR